MSRILILDGVSSTLSRQRGTVGAQSGHTIYWYAQSVDQTDMLPLAGRFAYLSARAPRQLQRLMYFIDPVQLAWLIRRFRIDLVHAHYAFQYFLPLAIPVHIPLVVTVMGGDVLPDQYYRGRWRPALTNRLLEGADIITVKSAYLERAVSAINPAWQPKIERITWGIDTTVFRSGLPIEDLRSKHDIPPDALIFFDVRLAQRFYRKHVILGAFARLPSTIPALLLVAEYKGEAGYLAELRDLARTLQIEDRVRFIGSVPHNEMARYLNLADVTVSVPPSDGMPQSLYEAMACGAFPVVGDLPQYAEILEGGVNALLVPVGEDEIAVAALSDALRRAALDPALRRNAAVINQARIMEIADREHQAARMNAIYARLLNSS